MSAESLERCVRFVAHDIRRSRINRAAQVDERMEDCSAIALEMLKQRIYSEAPNDTPLGYTARVLLGITEATHDNAG